jgi:hypothetical protein
MEGIRVIDLVGCICPSARRATFGSGMGGFGLTYFLYASIQFDLGPRWERGEGKDIDT